MSLKSMGKGETSSGGGSSGETVVIDVGQKTSSCGYCRSPGESSFSHGLWARILTVDDYQGLLDHGWRRCGSFLYKPDMKRTCCPSYTIRLKANDFVPSKEQLRVLKKFQRFLDGYQPNDTNCSTHLSSQGSQSSSKQMITENVPQVNEKRIEEDTFISYLSTRIEDSINVCRENGELPSTLQFPRAAVKKVRSHVKKRIVNNTSEDMLYTSNISFQIFAVLRQSQTAISSNVNQDGEGLELTANIIAEKLSCSINFTGQVRDISVKACNGHLNFYSSNDQISSCKFPSGDMVQPAHKDVRLASKRGLPPDKNSTIPLKKRRLEIRMKRSCFDPEEYALYRRYQIKVHGDKPEDVTKGAYKRFLVDTPLTFIPTLSGREVPSCGFGSFHQQYIIDGKLVAVGVVDILPNCLSSKYLFWDPDFAFLSLGKFSALKEIEWVRDMQTQCQSLQYHYLGYYIHSCSKMRYKAEYKPSELLCPLRYRWVPYLVARPLLDEKSYVVLSDFTNIQNGSSSAAELLNSCSGTGGDIHEGVPSGSNGELNDDDINNIMIDLNGIRVKFKDLRQVVRRIKQSALESLKIQLHRYARTIGGGLADHMIYVLQ